MKKLALTMLSAFVLGVVASAADSVPKVPDGIDYKAAPREVNAIATARLKACFKEAPYRLDPLLADRVICAPEVWAVVKDHAAFKGVKISPAVLHLPVEGEIQKRDATFIENEDQRAAFCLAMQDYLKSPKAYEIRPLTESELKLYWSILPVVISEPIYVADNTERAILLHFDEQTKVFWIGDFARLVIEK